MKKSQKIIAALLVCTIPLAVFAHDKYENHHDKHEYKNYKYEFFDDDEKNDDFMKKDIKGANLLFEGKLQKKPKNSYNGKWLISGVEVIVDDSTIIYRADKKIKDGDELYVAAKREKGVVKALVIEQDD